MLATIVKNISWSSEHLSTEECSLETKISYILYPSHFQFSLFTINEYAFTCLSTIPRNGGYNGGFSKNTKDFSVKNNKCEKQQINITMKYIYNVIN